MAASCQIGDKCRVPCDLNSFEAALLLSGLPEGPTLIGAWPNRTSDSISHDMITCPSDASIQNN
jgi:hypothetical protein